MKRKRIGKGSAALLLIALLLAPTLLAPLSRAQGTEYKFAEKLWQKLMAQNEVWKGTGLFVSLETEKIVEIPGSASALEKMTKVAARLKASGFLTQDQFNKVLEYLASDRRYDIAGYMKTLKVDFSRRLICIETKTAIENKAHVVAELIRDMYLAYTDPEGVGKIVYIYPAHDKDVRDWVMEMVETVGEAFEEEFGLKELGVKGGGALGEKALVVYASDQYFLDWTGIGGQTMYRFLSIAGHIALYVLYVATMSAVLVNAPPNTVLASVGYSGYGSGGTIVVVVYFDLEGGYSDEQVFITDIHVRLEVNGTHFTLAQFPLPVWVRSGGMLLEPEPFVIPSSAAPTPPVQLPTAPWLSYDGQKLHFEVPLKRYTVRVTQPDGTVVVRDVMDVFVLDADVNRAEIGYASVKTYETKSASVIQILVNQWVDRASPPPSQVTNVNPAPPTPYVTVKVSVASGCGRVTVIPLLWFYPSGPEVSVPNGSLVVLRAYPCEGCSLRYWEVSDGLRTWFEYGTSVGFKVNRSVTALAYFTEQPEVPKLVLRAETVDREPVYANMSGWVFWVDYSNVVHNTTLSNATFYRLEYTLNQWKPIGFKVAANGTASWVGVPFYYGGYSASFSGPCGYCYLYEDALPALNGLHLLLVQAKGRAGYVTVKSGRVHFDDYYGTCRVDSGAGEAGRVSGWCVYRGIYNFNNEKPTAAMGDASMDAYAVYAVAKRVSALKLLRWELRGPDGTEYVWHGSEAYLPVWFNSTAGRWEGQLYPLRSKPDAVYELVAVYGPPEATLTVKVYMVLPDGSKVPLSSIPVSATTSDAFASSSTNGSGVVQFKLPTGSTVQLAFPRVAYPLAYRSGVYASSTTNSSLVYEPVVERVTYNGAALSALLYEDRNVTVTAYNCSTSTGFTVQGSPSLPQLQPSNCTSYTVNRTVTYASAFVPAFDKDATVEVVYRAVPPIAVAWTSGGAVQADFKPSSGPFAVYAESGMPVTLVTKPAVGYRFSRWLIVKLPWIGRAQSKSGRPWNGVLWIDTKYTGEWSVSASFDFEPFYRDRLTTVKLYLAAVDAQGRARTLAAKTLYLQYSGRQQVTLSWAGELYNEWLRAWLESDQTVTLYSITLSTLEAVLEFARENVTASQSAMCMEAWSKHRYEGMVRIVANASVPIQQLPQYRWRLTVVAVAPDGATRVLATTDWITGDKGTSASLTWTGALSDEWVKFVVENNQKYLTETLSAYVEPLLPANATVLYRWPVQLKAEFTQG